MNRIFFRVAVFPFLLFSAVACNGLPGRPSTSLSAAAEDGKAMSEASAERDAGSQIRGADGDATRRPLLSRRRDPDRDGIPEAVDECPDTLTPRPVDDRGCAVLDGVIEGLGFAPGEHRFDADGESVLLDLVAELKAYPRTVIRIEGHTDNRGSAAENLELSKQRVLEVARFLVANGVPASRLLPVGYGEGRPRAVNATAEGRELNRRIEIKVVAILPPPTG